MEQTRKKPGPKRQHLAPRKEYHLKFPASMADYIERESAATGYQAFFEALVRTHMEEHSRQFESDSESALKTT